MIFDLTMADASLAVNLTNLGFATPGPPSMVSAAKDSGSGRCECGDQVTEMGKSDSGIGVFEPTATTVLYELCDVVRAPWMKT